MPGNYSHTTRSTGTILTATIYNGDHQNHIDNQTPLGTDDYSSSQAVMQSAVDPGEVNTESFPTSLAGELERLRFIIKEMKAQSQWYVSSEKGSDIASASSLTIPEDGKFHDVTGNASITGIAAGSHPVGRIQELRFTGTPTLVHNGTSFILQGDQNWTLVAGDTFRFLHLGSGNWLEIGRNLKTAPRTDVLTIGMFYGLNNLVFT
jgi:hypothetical protein